MKRIIYFFLLIFFVSCSINKEKEVEPNNSKWDSQDLSVPVSILGRINASDVDYYRIMLQEEITNLIDIKVSTKHSNPLELDFYRQNRLIKSAYLSQTNFDNNQKDVVLKNLLLSRGIYYMRIIRKYNEYEDIKYDLQISEHSDIENMEREPNDLLVEANFLNISNGYMKGYFNPERNYENSEFDIYESDWYKFNITGKSNIITVEITSIPGIDSVIELYNHLGFLIKKANSMGIEEPEILKNFGILNEGQYYIRVYGKDINTQNYKIPYQLYVNRQKRDPNFEFEPNDSMGQAAEIAGTLKGYINPLSDIDWYTFSIDESKSVVNISVTPLNSVNLKLDLYNHMGGKLFTFDNYGVNKSEIMPNLLLDYGKYYITVSDTSNKNQNYLDSYTINIKRGFYNTDQEYEPNNSFKQAIRITNNNSYKGYISPKNDVDYYYLTLVENSYLKIDISPVPDINFIIEIYDDSMNKIRDINSKDKGKGESEILPFEAGIYYIILKDAENNSNFYENYIFSVYKR